MKNRKIKESWDNRLFSIAAHTVVILIALLCILPLIHVAAISVSDKGAVMRGDIGLVPAGFNIDVYKSILSDGSMVKAMVRSILLTCAYVVVSMTMTILCAYPLSVPDLKGKRFITLFCMFTMYFGGGMIPGYLLVNGLGLLNTYWALILPCAMSTYNMIVLRSFFVSIPPSLREAAMIDGAGDVTILLKVVLPLSKPALATVSLFYMVSRWNAMQDALLYINDTTMSILQIKLKYMIQNANAINELLAEAGGAADETQIVLQTVRSGTLIFSLIPVLIVYPFLQKYFVKGTMIGSVKG